MKPDTGDEVVDAILHTAHRIRTTTDAALRCIGLSLSGYKVLRALADQDRSMREVSEILHVTPRSVTDIVDGLQAQQVIERRPHHSDRRITLLHLTPEGRTRLAQARGDAERASRAVLDVLDGTERQQLLSLLHRVLDQATQPAAAQSGPACARG